MSSIFVITELINIDRIRSSLAFTEGVPERNKKYEPSQVEITSSRGKKALLKMASQLSWPTLLEKKIKA